MVKTEETVWKWNLDGAVIDLISHISILMDSPTQSRVPPQEGRLGNFCWYDETGENFAIEINLDVAIVLYDPKQISHKKHLMLLGICTSIGWPLECMTCYWSEENLK